MKMIFVTGLRRTTYRGKRSALFLYMNEADEGFSTF